jgi:hypothetical protein
MFHFVAALEAFVGPEALVDAERCALRALDIDPLLGEALIVLAQVHMQRGDWVTAASYFQSALASGADEASTYGVYGIFKGCAGQLRDALQQSMQAWRCAPSAPGILGMVAAWHSILGRDAEAVRHANLAIALGLPMANAPLPLVFANAALRAGEHSKAAKYIAQLLTPRVAAAGGAEVIDLVYAALANPGKKGVAIEELMSLRSRAGGPQDMGASLLHMVSFTLLAMLEDLDAAYRVANEGLDELQRLGTFGAAWGGLWVPELRAFRRDPRFQPFVTRLGLMRYWEQYGPPDDCELRDGKLICR